ncbi:MAG: TetR/AcrR family transcriptional regulator [Pseudomonadota bacterium]
MARSLAFDPDIALNAALDTFWQRGYQGSSIQVLLDAMGLNRGSLYNQFGDKDQLFQSVLMRYFQRYPELVISLLDHSPDPIAGIDAVFQLTLVQLPEQQRQCGCLLVNTVAELSDSHREHAEQAQALLTQVEQAFARALQRAQHSGQWQHPALNAKTAARLLFTYLTGLRITTRLGMPSEAIQEQITVLMQTLALHSTPEVKDAP